MATFRKRGNGWQVQVRRLGRAPLSRTFGSKREAAQWAIQVEAQAPSLSPETSSAARTTRGTSCGAIGVTSLQQSAAA
jgi:hypothetical protein